MQPLNPQPLSHTFPLPGVVLFVPRATFFTVTKPVVVCPGLFEFDFGFDPDLGVPRERDIVRPVSLVCVYVNVYVNVSRCTRSSSTT